MHTLLIQLNETLVSVGFTIIGAILLLFLGIIGYFLKEFGEGVKQLKDIVKELQITVSTEKNKADSYWKACESKHGLLEEILKGVNTRIDYHGIKLAEHDLDIAVIKNEISLG